MSDIYFTMIVYVDSDELLKRAISNILDSSAKIVVADAVCSEASMRLCEMYEKKCGEKFKYIKACGMSIGEAYNVAIPEIEGRYVNFSLASTWFSAGTLQAVRFVAEKAGRPKLISLAPWTVNERQETVQYRMSPIAWSDNFSENVQLSSEPWKLQLMFHAYFVRCYLINSRERHMWFTPELYEDSILKMLCDLLAEIRGYVYLPKLKLNYTHPLEDNTSTFDHQYDEWWYLGSLKRWVLPFAEEWNSKDYPIRTPIKILLFYLVYARFNCNYNDRNKGVLQGDNLKMFLELSGKVLQYVDSQIIFSKKTFRNFVIPRGMRMLFLKLKAETAGKTCEVVAYGDQLLLWTHLKGRVTAHTISVMNSKYFPETEDLEKVDKELDNTSALFTVQRSRLSKEGSLLKERKVIQNDIPVMKWAYEDSVLVPLCEISKEHVIIRTINYRNSKLEIDGILSIGNFIDCRHIQLKVKGLETEITAKFSEVYGLEKVFGVTYQHKQIFHVTIPVLPISKRVVMQFVLSINGEDNIIEIHTQSIHSHVKEGIKGQYWKFAKGWCLSISGKKEMHLTMTNQKELNERETAYQKELCARAKKGDKAAAYAVELRKDYFAHKKEAPGERIWITYDKLYKAGDNGEYIYDYVSARSDGIDIRYIIKADSPDYERMRAKGDKLLVWGTKEALLTVLCAEVILQTHSNIASYIGCEEELVPYICDLFSPLIVCIQHGLTVQDIAQYQNRLFDNTHLYLCASHKEIENLKRPIYGYDEESLRLIGMARYDGLRSSERRQILITPTWRRDIVNSGVAHLKKGYNDSFKNSEYFRIYNRLINDERLIECAKKYRYRIIYLLHPATSAQIGDFDRNNYVELVAAAGDMNYEEILTQSSLMVTDYSGVQFDFAYMRKPLLYYHPVSLPPHYKESQAYRYEEDAFGPIIDTHERLVDELCNYMKNNCVMKEEYKKRADRFFAYSDFENCKRIYREVCGYISEERGE